MLPRRKGFWRYRSQRDLDRRHRHRPSPEKVPTQRSSSTAVDVGVDDPEPVVEIPLSTLCGLWALLEGTRDDLRNLILSARSKSPTRRTPPKFCMPFNPMPVSRRSLSTIVDVVLTREVMPITCIWPLWWRHSQRTLLTTASASAYTSGSLRVDTGHRDLVHPLEPTAFPARPSGSANRGEASPRAAHRDPQGQWADLTSLQCIAAESS